MAFSLNFASYDNFTKYGNFTKIVNFRSAIVTGCDAWTLYENEYYEGRCACVYPSDINNCYPGFYKTLGNVANQISSVRKGCFCNKKLAPSATMYDTKSAVIGNSESND